MTKWPEHKNPEEYRKARAPYNFVPLPKQVLYVRDAPDSEQSELPRQDRYYPEAERYTGWVACKLCTETPLYTRCALPPGEWKKRKVQEEKLRSLDDPPDFFYTDLEEREPVIPGSSLRGMLRNLMEIIGYSKVQPVTDQQKITYRAVAGQKPLNKPYQKALKTVKVGYLERRGEKWVVQPAWRPRDKGFSEKGWYLKVKDALIDAEAIEDFMPFDRKSYRPQYHKVTFESEEREGQHGPYTLVTSVTTPTENEDHRGVLICTGNMVESAKDQDEPLNSPRENYALVLEANNRAKAIPIDEQAIQDYLDTLTDFQKTSPPFNEKRGCLVEGRPIFYIERVGRVVAFGHCPNFRIPAWLEGSPKNRAATPRDFVPESYRDKTKTDLTEAIFGYVAAGKDGEETEQIKSARPLARRGRVCVTDAILSPEDQGNVWFDPQQPEVIPQILSLPKPTAFQLYLVQPEPNDPARLRHYSSKPGEETVIRGHKLYWHKPDLCREDWEEQQAVDEQKDKQHTRIKPIRAGLTFNFKIYFEALSLVELGALLWLLKIASEDAYRLKLGMAKPLGLGTVAVESDLHLTNRRARYTSLFQEEGGWHAGEPKAKDVKQIRAKALQAYTTGVLKNPVLNPQSTESFEEIPRIKMLLRLLRWQDTPDKSETSYMTLDADDHAYRERYVLPDPAGVLGEARTESSPTVSTTAPPSRPQPQRQVTEADVAHPEHVEDIQEGDVLKAIAVGIDAYRVEFELGVDATGTMGLERIKDLVETHPYFSSYAYLGEITFDAVQAEGYLIDDLREAPMLVSVREIEKQHGKILIKLDFEKWLIEERE